MTASEPISFGDRVRILVTDETRASGHAGWVGQCYGFTTPSVTAVEVVGPEGPDDAFSIHFEAEGVDAWFSPSVVELVDHGAGTEAQIGDTRLVRDEHGEWHPDK